VRLVVDTNVLLSGLFWRGAPHTLLERARSGELTLVTSPALLAELANVLARPRFVEHLGAAGKSVPSVLADLQVLADTISPPPLAQRVCRDPDDDDVLACAVAARADLIVTGDADLLSLASYEGIPIVAAAYALERSLAHR
jgi:putative PIN family toxin of toxin-antitoxin system